MVYNKQFSDYVQSTVSTREQLVGFASGCPGTRTPNLVLSRVETFHSPPPHKPTRIDVFFAIIHTVRLSFRCARDRSVYRWWEGVNIHFILYKSYNFIKSIRFRKNRLYSWWLAGLNPPKIIPLETPPVPDSRKSAEASSSRAEMYQQR